MVNVYTSFNNNIHQERRDRVETTFKPSDASIRLLAKMDQVPDQQKNLVVYKGTVYGKPVKILIDTGATETVMNTTFYNQYISLFTIEPFRETI